MKSLNIKKVKIPVLMYHEVSEVSERKKMLRGTNPAYSLSINQFHEQMKFLSDNNYQTLSLDEIVEAKGGKKEKSVVITFDDGFLNNYTNAFPILKELVFTATIFTVTDFVGTENYMDWEQLKEMNDFGISIQSHTASHKPLSMLSTNEIKAELYNSKKSIEDNLGSSVDFFSAPHGMVDERVIEISSNLSYIGICTSEQGYSHYLGFPAIFQRINISDRYSLPRYKKIVNMSPINFIVLKGSKILKNILKKVIGYNNYRKLYNLAYRIH